MKNTAEGIIEDLHQMATKKAKIANEKTFRWSSDESTKVIGVRMGEIFNIAKQNKDINTEEVQSLLDSMYYEGRVAAVSILDFKAKSEKITLQERKQLYDLYIKNHDCINNWGMVDRAAPHVIGRYLYEEDEGIESLVNLANSETIWERRTAIVATAYFIRQGITDPTYEIAEALKFDDHELINKAVGSWIREAGKKDENKLRKFLDRHSSELPRVTLRYAIEKLDESSQKKYLSRN